MLQLFIDVRAIIKSDPISKIKRREVDNMVLTSFVCVCDSRTYTCLCWDKKEVSFGLNNFNVKKLMNISYILERKLKAKFLDDRTHKSRIISRKN